MGCVTLRGARGVSLSALAAALALSADAADACGGREDACLTENGSYHIRLPDAAGQAPVPVMVFLHGWGSNGANSLNNPSLGQAVTARGWAYLTPNGVPRGGGRSGLTWGFHPDLPGNRDEIAFLQEVMADAVARHGLDPEQTMLAGFSIGGSMASYLACDTPEAFTTYAPLGGSFWRPHPEACAGPVRLFHTHGWRDGTVPLEGRPLGGGRIIQGDVFASLEILRRANGCTGLKAEAFETTETLWQRTWTSCADGSALTLALYDGGHIVPDYWADMVIDWVEALDAPEG